ncbi:hypothetical protein FH972_010205 [Carpinus fangiana]|uniref:Uncharacterized protein n=1 Tax=Carpinus fangiana TaxID=176857 RepID=A0A660KPH9_9ROSI|nr:hypothetical protein FH972_010205 [Carpinus fangiana]
MSSSFSSRSSSSRSSNLSKWLNRQRSNDSTVLLNALREVGTVNFSLEVNDVFLALRHIIRRANNYNNAEVQAQLLTELIQVFNRLLRPFHSSDFEAVANARLKPMLINLLFYPNEMYIQNPLGNKALTPAFVALPQLHPTPPLASLSDPYMLKGLFLHAKCPHILLCFTLQKQSITEHYFFHARVESS